MKNLHKKKISELDGIVPLNSDKVSHIPVHKLKEWAIDVVKENRKEIIRKLQDHCYDEDICTRFMKQLESNAERKRPSFRVVGFGGGFTLDIDQEIVFMVCENASLFDRFELTEDDLK